MQNTIYDRMNLIEQTTGKKVLDVMDAAKYLSVSEQTLYDFISCGLIRIVGNDTPKILPISLAQFELGTSNDLQIPTFENKLFSIFLEEYIGSLAGGVRLRTYQSHINMAKHIHNGLGHYSLSEINLPVLRSFINGFTLVQYKKGKNTDYYSQSTINKVYDLLSGTIREAYFQKLLPQNYMEYVEKPRSNQFKDKQVNALTDEEVNLLLDAVKDNPILNLWIHILLYTGVRPSESLALNISDINFSKRSIKITKTLSYTQEIDTITKKPCGPLSPIITTLKNFRNDGKTNFQKRELIVGARVIKAIHTWLNFLVSHPEIVAVKKENHSQDSLFCGTNGQFWIYNDYSQLYERHLAKKGIDSSKYNLYRFRHNYCTRLLRLKQDLKTVQMIMGDNDSAMVLKVYANMNQDDIASGCALYNQNMDFALDLA